jgi:hypothetical protein
MAMKQLVPFTKNATLGDCPICQDALQTTDPVLSCARKGVRRTHFFHALCLARWVGNKKVSGSSASCPVCRGPLPVEAEMLGNILAKKQVAEGMQEEEELTDDTLREVRRLLTAIGGPTRVRSSTVVEFTSWGVVCGCARIDGGIVFQAPIIVTVGQDSIAEVSAVLEAQLQGARVETNDDGVRLEVDPDGSVSVTVTLLTGSEPPTQEAVRQALELLGRHVVEVPKKLGPFIQREPGQTFLYLMGPQTGPIQAFDISDEACHRHAPFSHGDRVRNPVTGSMATTIGVRNDDCGESQLWFHSDGNRGAGVFDAATLWTLEKIGHQTVEPAA